MFEQSTPDALNIEPKIYQRSEHNISRRDIDPDALKIMYRLHQGGYKAYMVGGGVRDLLLGKAPKDFDIATDATPKQVKSLFRNCRIIGRRFKLAHVYFWGNKIIEVATFRGPSDPLEQVDDPDAVFGDNTFGSEVTDAFRRDLTINGLFYDLATFSIIDYVGGVEDLRAGLVRIIGDPTTRLKEDPVRLIRTVRHAVKAGLQIDTDTLHAVRANAHLINQSPEARVFEELRKDFASGISFKILAGLYENHLLQHLLPELTESKNYLLFEDSPFAHALLAIDERVAGGETVSLAIPLALIVLFSFDPIALGFKGKPGVIGLAAFEHPDELDDHLAECFQNLAVPRREREKIAGLLFYAFQLVHGQVKLAKLRSSGYLMEMRDLFAALSANNEYLEIAEELNVYAENPPPKEEQEDDGRRNRNRRGRSRRGRR